MPRRSPLPILQPAAPGPTIRASKMGRWRTAVLIGVHLLIAAHIAHWLIKGRTITPVEPSEAMAFSKAGIVNAGLLFFAAVILLTAVFGRWFCGWACHVVALQDGSLWLLKKLGIRPKPLRSRLLRWVPALAFLYMFVWPAAYRLWYGDSLSVRGSEMTTSAFWSTFPGWVIGALTFLVCGFAAVYFLGAKGFCTYACPYGAAFSWADKTASLRVRVTDACQGCGHCTAVCTSNVRVHEEVRDYKMVVDPGCMKCGDCVSVCPNDALYFGFGRLPLLAQLKSRPRGPEPETRRYPLAWSEEIAVAAVFAVTFLIYRGLFGYVPFLMALGLSGCLAFVALLGFRLARRPSYSFRHRELKRDGHLRPAGRLWVAALAATVAITAWAAVLHADVWLGERDFRRLGGLRGRALDLTIDPASTAAAPGTAESALLATSAARFERAARRSPVAWLGLDSRLAWTRYLRGDSAGFATAAVRGLSRGDAAEELLRLSALAAIDRGDTSSAIAAIERLDAETGAVLTGDSWAAFATRAGRSGRIGAASALLDRGLAHFPESAALHYNSAIVAAIQSQPDKAAEGFRRALAIDPDLREARENLAGMLASLGRYEEAIVVFRESVARSPADAELRLMLARALRETGARDEAVSELERALSLAPQNESALALRAEWANENERKGPEPNED